MKRITEKGKWVLAYEGKGNMETERRAENEVNIDRKKG